MAVAVVPEEAAAEEEAAGAAAAAAAFPWVGREGEAQREGTRWRPAEPARPRP